MNLKTKIKNDLWRINWIVPHTSKYLFYGKKEYVKRAIPIIASMKVVHTSGTIEDDIIMLMKKCELKANGSRHFFYWIDEHKTILAKGNVISNFTLDYSKIVENGFDEICDTVIKGGDEYSKRATKIKTAVHILHERITDSIGKSEGEYDNKESLIECFASLLTDKAEHFEDALQRILFFNQFLWQTRHRLNGLGRLDKVLNDVYLKDIESGYITKNHAEELIFDFYRILGKWSEYKSSAMLGDIGQIIILGGLETDGTYFCNELTELFLKVQARANQPDPKILLRVSNNTPDWVWEKAMDTLCAKTGSPLFSNDDVVIPAISRNVFDKEDSYNYGVSACWEPYIIGKSLDQNNLRTFDFWENFSSFLNAANCDKYNTFDELINDYLLNLEESGRSFAEGLDDFIWCEDIFVSLFFDECNWQKNDISKGGAKYSNYGITTVGLAALCDSLLNIKTVVYENDDLNSAINLKELNSIRNDNYNNNDAIYYSLKNLNNHFGHDSVETIEMVNKLIEAFNKGISKVKNSLNGNIKFGLSAPDYIKLGKKSSADFAGRRKGEPYNTHISCLDAAYTEIALFASKINYVSNCINGNVIDFFVTPDLIENNRDAFISYLKTSIKLGIYQLQMNVMDSKTLIDAKANPEKYPGLIVRVWGFSAYFNELPEDYKDQLIKRAIESEKVG